VSDYETIQRRRNIIVGVFVVGGMCALGWLVSKFGDMPGLFSRMGSYNVRVQFAKAPGVQKDTPVYFCGYQIGRVMTVLAPSRMPEVDPNTKADPHAGVDASAEAKTKKYHQTVVILSIDESHKDIPRDVDVKLMTRGFGSSFIELQLKKDKVYGDDELLLRQDPRLQGSTGVTSEFFPEETQEELRELVTDMRTFVNKANHILGDPNNKKADLDKAIANLADVSDLAVARLREAGGTLRDVNETLDLIKKAIIKDVRPAIADFRKLMNTGSDVLTHVDANSERLVVALVEASGELGETLSELRLILEKVNNGKGSAARFVNDGEFYEALLDNAEQVELLLKEIKAFVSRAREKGLPFKLR